MKLLKISLVAVYVLSVAWICIFQTKNVFGNLEASYIWAAPAVGGGIFKLHSIHRDVKKHNKENHDD